MKTLLFLFFALMCVLFSCQPSPKVQNEDDSDAQEEFVDTTPKATAIFWVDKNKKLPGYMSGKPVPIRTLKAQVEIDTVGCIEVLSYVKPQAESVKKHINRCLETFRVKKVLMDSAYINPGIQYVQIRYTPSKIKD